MPMGSGSGGVGAGGSTSYATGNAPPSGYRPSASAPQYFQPVYQPQYNQSYGGFSPFQGGFSGGFSPFQGGFGGGFSPYGGGFGGGFSPFQPAMERSIGFGGSSGPGNIGGGFQPPGQMPYRRPDALSPADSLKQAQQAYASSGMGGLAKLYGEPMAQPAVMPQMTSPDATSDMTFGHTGIGIPPGSTMNGVPVQTPSTAFSGRQDAPSSMPFVQPTGTRNFMTDLLGRAQRANQRTANVPQPMYNAASWSQPAIQYRPNFFPRPQNQAAASVGGDYAYNYGGGMAAGGITNLLPKRK